MSGQPHAFDCHYVNALRQGDPAIQAHFVDHFSPILLKNLRRKLRSADQVRDLTQETFRRVLTAVRSDHGVHRPERFEVFVVSVCNNIVRETWREQRRSVPMSGLEDELVNDRPSPYALVAWSETRDNVHRILRRLNALDRAILKAVLLDKQSKDEVCQRLGVTRDYLRVLLCRAKERFRIEVRKGGHRQVPMEPIPTHSA